MLHNQKSIKIAVFQVGGQFDGSDMEQCYTIKSQLIASIMYFRGQFDGGGTYLIYGAMLHNQRLYSSTYYMQCTSGLRTV